MIGILILKNFLKRNSVFVDPRSFRRKINIPKVVFSQKTKKMDKRNRKVLLGATETNDAINLTDYEPLSYTN